MNVNGTKFHLLLGETDWKEGAHHPDLRWRGGLLELRALPFVFPPPLGSAALPLTVRYGAARDTFGNIYWTDGQEVWARSAGDGTTTPFWSPLDTPAPCRDGATFAPLDTPAPLPPQALRGLCVTEDHYLLVGAPDLPGLLIFDLHGGGPPRPMPWSGATQAMDLCPRPGGGAFMLDSAGWVWRLGRTLSLDAADLVSPAVPLSFQPLDGLDVRLEAAVPVAAGVDISAVGEAIAIEAVACDELLILTRTQEVYVLRPGYPPEQVPVSDLPATLNGRKAHDFVRLAAQGECPAADDLGSLYTVLEDGEQVARCTLKRQAAGGLRLTFDPCFFPLRRYTGQCLVAGQRQGFYLHQSPEGSGVRWLPIVPQSRPQYARQATLRLAPLDGKELGCVWHRLMLDLNLPDGCSVTVRSRAADDLDRLPLHSWYEEPVPYRRARGRELPYAPSSTCGTYELLFQQSRGQYLELELSLTGDGRRTPQLHALRAWYPRFSYLQYLPGIYRHDAGSADQLDRYLANVEGQFTELEDQLAAVQALFDANAAPAEALEWLAGWFSLALDPAWTEQKRRLLLGHALEFFQYRGTVRGLHLALQLAFETSPGDALFQQPEPPPAARSVRLIERFRTWRAPGRTRGTSVCRQVIPVTIWHPAQHTSLNALYRAAYAAAQATWGLLSYPAPLTFPTSVLLDPRDPREQPFWQMFCTQHLDFLPQATPADLPLWRAFLLRRYRTLAGLNAAHGRSDDDLQQVALPATLPDSGALVLDWYEFETQILPRQRSAHRFSVMLPVPAGAQAGGATLQDQRELARRIVDLEKPAHTLFDLGFYWAMFRVGEARLGLDTVLESSSRAAPLRLGYGHLAEGFLSRDSTPLPGRLRLGEFSSSDC